jgi:N-acetylmuramoyl-L-alanine amidase
MLRVHADGSTDRSVNGTHTLYPARRVGWTDDVYAPSRVGARVVQRGVVARLGSRNLGLQERADLTGFNWANVPVVLVELGFLSNPREDRLLATPAYRACAAAGLRDGTLAFLRR